MKPPFPALISDDAHRIFHTVLKPATKCPHCDHVAPPDPVTLIVGAIDRLTDAIRELATNHAGKVR